MLLSEKYTLQWHVEQFRNLCASLHGFVNTCVFSFVDLYTKISTKLRAIGARVLTNEEMLFIAKEFSTVAQDYNITLKTCTESVNLETFGIERIGVELPKELFTSCVFLSVESAVFEP